MKLLPFSPNEVAFGGELARRLDITVDKILHHSDVEKNFARHYHARKEEPEVPGGFTGYGMLLDAVVKAAVHGVGGKELLHFKRDRIADLLSTMSADGNISVFAGKAGFWDNHDQAYLIQALVLDHRHFGEKASLEAAVRVADHLIGRGSGVNIGLETAFLMLFQETGETRFLDYCRDTFKITEGHDVYDTIMPCNGTQHVYSWIARCLAQLQYMELTGERGEALLAGTRELYRRVFEGGYASISGSCSGGRFWGEVWDKSQMGLGQWGETCVSAYLLRCTAKMMAFDAQSRYGDLFERVMYNAFWGAQSHDGLQQRYFIPFDEPGQWYDHETYCCPNNLRRMMFELPDSIYLHAPDGIAVNLYTPSTLATEQATIVQETDYPFGEEVVLHVTSEGLFTLYLRMPSWCPAATVEVGDEHYDVGYHGWFRAERQWHGTTAVKIRFQMPIRLVAGTAAQRGKAAVMRGPVVYAYAAGQPQDEVAAADTPVLRPLNMDNLTRLDRAIAVIDTSVPLQPEGRETIVATAFVRFGRSQRFHLRFTPFASEKRLQTYFQVSDPDALQKDELLASD